MSYKSILTDNDLELIDIAQSTTYQDTIWQCIQKADSEEARRILTGILEDLETEFEKPSRRW